MLSFARVAVNVPSLAGVFFDGGSETAERVPGAFDYEVPARLQDVVRPGSLVRIPFANRLAQGVVLELVDVPAVQQTREIAEVVDPEPVMTGAQIALAKWMQRATFTTIGPIVDLFLPPGLAQQVDTVYETSGGPEPVAGAGTNRSPVEKRLIALLRARGPLRGRQIDRALPHVEWRRIAQRLARNGALSSRSVLPPAGIRPKSIRTAQLAVSPAQAEAAMAELGTTAATRQRRQRALRYLVRLPEAVNVSWVYAESGCNLNDLQELADRDLIVLREHEVWRDPLNRDAAPTDRPLPVAEAAPVLTAEQQVAWQAIEQAFLRNERGESVKPFLLSGVTGSGKTELYLRAVMESARRGRQAIVLVPEIALTPQMVSRFVLRFPGEVGLIHSRLSDGERYDTWRRARAGLLRVVIGPRSALFAPLPRLGVLVADECHDASYHQAEPPFYDALPAMQTYAAESGAVCIMGSATPGIVQRYQAETGRAVELQLTQRIATAAEQAPPPTLDLPEVRIVDMREELKAGVRGSFSRDLQQALADVLERREQAILFLNRRGTATHVFCRNCGFVLRCPRCDTPLTYHTSAAETLLCHRCSYERKMPRKCPECGSADIRAYGLGTEKVEAEVQVMLPRARTLRWDWETTRERDAHEIILHHFAAGRADVLIGTQMLAKGLDLPRVTLVGIVMADVGLFLPDPFAAERVFQVLTQVAGRAGRSTRGGRVVLQTYAPEHYAIQAAARHDVDGFYKQELEQRRRLGFPPFSRLLRLEYRHYEAAKAEQKARQAADFLTRRLEDGQGPWTMIGPAPCFFSKVNGKYRWQIVLRGGSFAGALDPRVFEDWRVEVNPVSLL